MRNSFMTVKCKCSDDCEDTKEGHSHIKYQEDNTLYLYCPRCGFRTSSRITLAGAAFEWNNSNMPGAVLSAEYAIGTKNCSSITMEPPIDAAMQECGIVSIEEDDFPDVPEGKTIFEMWWEGDDDDSVES